MMFKKLRRALKRLVNPNRSFVDEIFEDLPTGPPTRAEQLRHRRELQRMGYDVSQLPPIRDYH